NEISFLGRAGPVFPLPRSIADDATTAATLPRAPTTAIVPPPGFTRRRGPPRVATASLSLSLSLSFVSCSRLQAVRELRRVAGLLSRGFDFEHCYRGGSAKCVGRVEVKERAGEAVDERSRRLREMKLRVVCRKLYDYVRYDLKEIAFPSSLPDPPHIKKRRKLTWHDRFLVLKEASRLYAASWVRDIGPELRPNDYKKDEDSEDKPRRAKKVAEEKEPSTLEDLAVAARGGMETLKPALQRVYMMRASAYRDALKSFIEGYQEGVQQVMEKKGDATSQKTGDAPEKMN
ncbi:hypothetical protein EUGRSUZ_A02626, partial [Eucalyptus grandis]